MSAPRNPQTQDKYVLRFADSSMRNRLKGQAKRNKRSLNAEILKILQDSVEGNSTNAGNDERQIGLRDQLAKATESITFHSSKLQTLLKEIELANWKIDDK